MTWGERTRESVEESDVRGGGQGVAPCSFSVHSPFPSESARAGVVKIGVHCAEAGWREKEEIGVNEHGLFCPSLLEISIV